MEDSHYYFRGCGFGGQGRAEKSKLEIVIWKFRACWGGAGHGLYSIRYVRPNSSNDYSEMSIG
jgi:hypothetical protein